MPSCSATTCLSLPTQAIQSLLSSRQRVTSPSETPVPSSLQRREVKCFVSSGCNPDQSPPDIPITILITTNAPETQSSATPSSPTSSSSRADASTQLLSATADRPSSFTSDLASHDSPITVSTGPLAPASTSTLTVPDPTSILSVISTSDHASFTPPSATSASLTFSSSAVTIETSGGRVSLPPTSTDPASSFSPPAISDHVTPTPTSDPSTSNPQSHHLSTGAIFGLAVGLGIAATCIVLALCWYIARRRRRRGTAWSVRCDGPFTVDGRGSSSPSPSSLAAASTSPPNVSDQDWCGGGSEAWLSGKVHANADGSSMAQVPLAVEWSKRDRMTEAYCSSGSDIEGEVLHITSVYAPGYHQNQNQGYETDGRPRWTQGRTETRKGVADLDDFDQHSTSDWSTITPA